MIFTRMTIAGSIVEDYKTLNVNRTMDEANASSSFEAVLDSPYGRHRNDYTVGNEVKIFAGSPLSYSSLGSTYYSSYSATGSSIIGSQLVASGTGIYFNDYSTNLSGTYISQNGSSLIGSYYIGSYVIGSFIDGTSGLGVAGSYDVTATALTRLTSVSGTIFGYMKGETFTSEYTGSLYKSYFKLATSNTGSVCSRLYSLGTDGLPSGNILGESSYVSFTDIGSKTGGSFIGFSFTGSSACPILSGTNYAILAFYSGTSSIDIITSGAYIGSGLSLGNTGSWSVSASDRPFIVQANNSYYYTSNFGSAIINDYSNQYIGSVSLIGSSLIGSQLINGNYAYNWDFTYNGSNWLSLGSQLGSPLFTGILEKKVYSGEETTQTLEISGRDYVARLQDLTVEPIVFSNQEISTIVTNIMSNNGVQDITLNNVDVTSVTLKRIGFNHTPIFEALNQLANLAGFVWYVDSNKDLHFEKAENISTGYIFDNSNIINCDFDKSREGMANKIWVYGDRYLSEAPNEVFKFGSPVGLSGVSLIYKPHNTRVSYLGSVMKGSIQGMTIIPTSGEDYGVSYDDRTVVFYSGTSLGYSSIPSSGGSVVIAYDRDLPIVKYGQDDNSISLYGPKVLKIQDNTIKDPQTAMDILKEKLTLVDPLNRVNCKIRGWYELTPGNLVNLQIDNFNLNQELQVVEATYKFDKETIQSENIINLTVSKKFLDITDKIKELKNRLDALEAQNLQDTDVLTRLISSSDSLQVVGSRYNVYSRSIAGETLIYNSPYFGIYNTAKYGGGSLVTGFVLGTTNSAILGVSLLGQNYSNFQLLFSGGYY